MHRKRYVVAAIIFFAVSWSKAYGQSPSVLYSWDGPSDTDGWGKNFGDNSVLLDNNIAGKLRIIEIGTPGEDLAIKDGDNRVRESSFAQGGLDLTGLDFLEFDIGHNGSGNVDVQFYIQGSTGFTYVALGPDVAVAPGMQTYSLPLSGLTLEQQVYIRTIGFNVREHFGEGMLVWTVEEVRSAGTPLEVRDLVTHDIGTSDNGLQGAVTNFDLGAIAGNDGGQNQSGLSHNASGSGSLQWTDLGHYGMGNSSGGAVSWGNGTAWNGNSFNERITDLSNYDFVTFRIKATDVVPSGGGTVDVQSFFQTGSGFDFQQAGAIQPLAIDGKFRDMTFPLAGLTELEVTDLIGINLSPHANDITIDVDFVRFTTIPEPSSCSLFAAATFVWLPIVRRRRRGSPDIAAGNDNANCKSQNI